MLEHYTFWDLIAQESYKTKIEELKKHSLTVFENECKLKDIWLFGCNAANAQIIEEYRKIWNIRGILDNSSAMWGKLFCDIKVYEPDKIIPILDEDKDIIIISLRLNADIVYRQITGMGFYNIYSLGVLIAETEPYRSFVEETKILIEQSELSDVVLMESMNDFDGNVGALYEFLKRSDSGYHFVWICKSRESSSDYFDDRDRILYPNSSIEDLKAYIKIRATAKWEIWECDPIRKVRSDQINVFLQHYGMGYKQVAHLYNSPEYVDYVLTTNEFVHGLENKSITYAPTSRFIYGELPRNDVLYMTGWNELSKITDRKYKKVIMWAPTLRESRFFNRIDSDISYPFGISLIYKIEDMNSLNKRLSELEMLLIVKIHPRQKINFKVIDCSNIIYLDGNSIKGIHAYKFLTQIDALITDYSSIVFDYMLLDRPCAWVLEDRAHYKIEYLMDDPEKFMPGDKIYTMDDLFKFMDDICEGNDIYCEDRRRICSLCNPPFEGRGCEQLVEALGL